ncbi:MAG: oleate hydratase, partial [Turicibacter sp.]
MSRKSNKKLVAATALAGVTAAGIMGAKKYNKAKNIKQLNESLGQVDIDRDVYFVGGGLGTLAGAAYLIRDCGMDGSRIHIIEGMHILGGSNDGAGTVENGFVCRGGRMLNEET